MRTASAKTIQSRYRLYIARQQLLAQLRLAFIKDFDPNTTDAIYKNLRTGQTYKSKPKLLWEGDLEFIDKWVLMKDLSGKGFYYNAKQLRQSWTLPPECVTCEHCQSEFSAFYCPQVDLSYCTSCYEQHFSQDNSISFGMSKLDGGLHVAQDILAKHRNSHGKIL